MQMQPQMPEMETTMVPQHVSAPQIPEMEKPRIITLNDPDNPYYNHYEREPQPQYQQYGGNATWQPPATGGMPQHSSVAGQRVLTKYEYDFI